MKTTFVSTIAMQNAAKLAIQRAQSEVADTQKEITTGRHADIGLALGASTARTLSLTREVARLDSLLDSNALVTQRLSVSQQALGQMSDNAQTMLETLIAVRSSTDANQLSVARREIEAVLDNFTSLANVASGGEFMFAGINTDVRPLNEYSAGSAAKATFDAEFLGYFGFAQTDPLAQTITGAQIDDFLTTRIEPIFNGAQWNADWSNASDTNLSNRITNSEVIESSTNANATGFRTFALAAVVSVELLEMNLGGDARSALADKLVGYAGSAISGLDGERANLGVAQSRVAKADDALSAQKDVMSIYIGELEGVDPYEASTRMNTLLTQMEASFALTSRIQQMSLINYL